QSGEGAGRVQRPRPLAVGAELRDLAAEVVDEGERRVPVLPGDVERREGRVGLVARHQLLAVGDELTEARRRALDAGLLEQAGAVDDDAGATVVRDGHELPAV